MSWYQKVSGQVMGLTLQDIENYPGNHKPYRGLNGSLRFFCPLHGSDHQRSFKLNTYTGHFKCYNCGSWGYVDEINKIPHKPHKKYLKLKLQQQQNKIPKIDVVMSYLEMYKALSDSNDDHIAIRYLKWRGIQRKTALYYGLGYAPWGKWPQYNSEGKLCRQWKRGRLVFPHTDPNINIVNLYGRAIGGHDVPKHSRHDNLNLTKGVFNCKALQEDKVIICEGAMDALTLLQAGYNACGIFGTRGFNIDWVKSNEIVFAFDNDQTGNESWKPLADQLIKKGKRVYKLAHKWYEGYKDVADLYQQKRKFNPLKLVSYHREGDRDEKNRESVI